MDAQNSQQQTLSIRDPPPLSPLANPPSTPPPRRPSSSLSKALGRGELLQSELSPSKLARSLKRKAHGLHPPVAQPQAKPASKGIRLLPESNDPRKLKDLLRQSVAEGALSAREADEAFQSYQQTRDSAALLQLIEAAALKLSPPPETPPRSSYIHHLTPSQSFESLARTVDSDFSISNFPQPPSPTPDSTQQKPLSLSRHSTIDSQHRLATPPLASSNLEADNMGNSANGSPSNAKADTPQRAILQDPPSAHHESALRSNGAQRQDLSPGDILNATFSARQPQKLQSPTAVLVTGPSQSNRPPRGRPQALFQDEESDPTAVDASAAITSKPVPTSTWMGKLSTVFQRKPDNATTLLQGHGKPDRPDLPPVPSFIDERGAPTVQQTINVPFFKHSNQSSPLLGKIPMSYPTDRLRVSVSASQISNSKPQQTPRHRRDSEAGLGLDHVKETEVDVDEGKQSSSPKDIFSRPASEVEARDSFEDVNLGSQDGSEEEADFQSRPKGQSRISGFSTFDFGISGNGTSPPRAGLRNRSSISAGQPPSSPLPPGPPSGFPRAVFQASREASSNLDALSQSSSYGDTSTLLDMHRQIASKAVTEVAAKTINSLPRRSGSFPLVDKDPNACLGSGARLSTQIGINRPDMRRNFSGQSNNELSTFRMTRAITFNAQGDIGSRKGSTVSGTSSLNNLDREISFEMRRIGRLSGIAQPANSIVVFNENGILDEDSEESCHEIGAAGPRSSSSHSFSSHRNSVVSDDSGHGGSDKAEEWATTVGQPRSKVTDKGSFAASIPSTKASGSSREDDYMRQGFEQEDDEGEWETVAGSGVSRSGTGLGLSHGITGSSLADYSSHASLSPKRRSYSPTRYSQDLPPLLTDERYEQVYHVHRLAPDGEPVLLPAYNFKNGAGFPAPDAFDQAIPANLSSANRYQHPTPLSQDHVHPFKSSPPMVMGSGRVLSRPYSFSPSPEPASPKDLSPRPETDAARDRGGRISEQSMQQLGCRHQNDSFAHTTNFLDMDSSYPSSAWMDAFLETGLEAPESQGVPGPNGSFAKVTILGPKVNITGTPDGTGMRQVGSSLADASSPGMNLSSSPGYPVSSPEDIAPPVPQHHVPLSRPAPAHLPVGRKQSGQEKQQPGVLYEQIRAHRELLAAEGLLPRSFTPPVPRPISGPLTTNSLMNLRSSFLNSSSANAASRSHSPAPFYLNPTPPLPPPRDSEKFIGMDYRLHRHPRENSDTDTAVWKRKQNLSRAILGMCFLFPPLLLLYAYGMLDVLISSLTSGTITHLADREKRIALVVGWTFAGAAICGIVVGMIIIGIGK